MLNPDCIALIEEFVGVADKWKQRFSIDVLPKIDQGWIEVGMTSAGPCSNCYIYGDSEHWGDFKNMCLACANKDTQETMLVNFDQIKKHAKFGYLDNYEMFQKFKAAASDIDFVFIEDSMLTSSPLFREIQMINLV